MTGARAAAVAALVVLVGLSAVAPVVAQTGSSGQVIGQPELDAVVSNPELEPGTRTTLDLTLSNRARISEGGPAQYEERVTTARGVVVEARPGSAPIEVNSGAVGVGNVPTGTVAVPPIEVTVDEDAAPGTYRVPVDVSYAYTRGVDYDSFGAEYNDFTEEETQYVTVRVRSQSRFAVVDRSSSAQVGDRGSLSVTLENTGSEPARDASVTATSRSDELRFGTGSERSTGYVGAWAPGERRTVEYTVEMTDDATLRDYTVGLTVDYADADGVDRTSRTLRAGVRPAAAQSFALANVSASLRVGEEGTVTGAVVNEGPEPVRSPVVVLSVSNPNVVVDANEYALSDLAPGERARFAFDVTVSSAASAGVQQFSFTTRYRTERGDRRTSDGSEAAVDIAPRRDRFGVALADGTVAAGSSRPVTVRVTNRGDEPLRNVEVKAFVTDPLSSDDDEGVVPRLAPGETANVTVALGADGDALRKRYPVSFDLQYERPDGDVETSRTYTASVRVTPSEGGRFPVGLAVGAAVLVGALGVVGWRRRSR